MKIVSLFESSDTVAMSAKGKRALLRERRACPSTSSMDDWYLDVIKRNANRVSVVDTQQPHGYRPRSGSFKHTVTFVTGKWNAFV